MSRLKDNLLFDLGRVLIGRLSAKRVREMYEHLRKTEELLRETQDRLEERTRQTDMLMARQARQHQENFNLRQKLSAQVDHAEDQY